MTPGFLASSSLILNTTFIRSEPMSAILVKMPPAIRSAAAPSDSPIAKPRKQAPATSAGMKRRMASMKSSSTEMSIIPTLMPARSGMAHTGHASQAEQQEDRDLGKLESGHHEVDDDDGADEAKQRQEQFALLPHVGLTGHVYELGDFRQGAVDREVFYPGV